MQLFLAGKRILTLNTHPSGQSKLRGICKLAGKPKNCKDGAKVCLIKCTSGEAGQEAGNREKQMFEGLCGYNNVTCWLRLSEPGQMVRLLYKLLYSLPGERLGSTTQMFSPALSAVALTSPNLPASVSPLLPIGHPGTFKSHSPHPPGCKIPKTQEADSSTHSVLCSASLNSPFSQRSCRGRRSPAAGWCPSLHLLPWVLCWPAAPSRLSALGAGSCSDQSRCDCPVPSHQQKDLPLQHYERWVLWDPSMTCRPKRSRRREQSHWVTSICSSAHKQELKCFRSRSGA